MSVDASHLCKAKESYSKQIFNYVLNRVWLCGRMRLGWLYSVKVALGIAVGA